MSKKKVCIIFISILYFLCFTHETYAAEVTFAVVPHDAHNDAVTVIEAYIDPKGIPLNAVEGAIGLLGAGVEHVSSVVVETGGSAFTLWPVTPSYSIEEKVVRFTGGSPEGFVEKGLLFRMRIFSKKPSEITVSWLRGAAYQSNGEGTLEGISSRSLVVSLSQSELNQMNAASTDAVPPYFDTLLVSQDPDVYEGKYFVSFHAADDASGVERYEVIEGGVTTETQNGMYVLLAQDRKNRVVIIAYDKAGNSTSIKVPTRYEPLYNALIACIIFAAVLLVFFSRRSKPK